MKKILKSSPPNVLILYEISNPTKKWEDFRNFNGGKDYSKLKILIFQDQGQLCAYCETRIENNQYEKQRIEHFNDKSNSTPINNLHLKWDNVFGVCLGGSDIRNKDNPQFRTPENLSCDAYKGKNITILNPLYMISFPNLFQLDRRTCELKANTSNCQLLSFLDNPYNTTEEFVTNTIRDLNLNCNRLTNNRYKILINYNQEIEKGRKAKDRNVFKKLAQKWFSKKFPSFFTTRRILLGKHAEEFLIRNHYRG